MTRCIGCGEEMERGWLYCPWCGKRHILRKCPWCGKVHVVQYESSRMFCGKPCHAKYINAAKAKLESTGDVDATMARYPFVNRKTVEHWDAERRYAKLHC